jgi:hypothetical protein
MNQTNNEINSKTMNFSDSGNSYNSGNNNLLNSNEMISSTNYFNSNLNNFSGNETQKITTTINKTTIKIMANFSGTMNLMGFKGAKVFTNLDQQRPQMAWVCIPVPYNDIQLSQDGKYANARVFMAETNAGGAATFMLTPGIYEFSTTSQFIDTSGETWWRYNFNGTRSQVVVSPEAENRVELTLKMSRKRIVH